MYLSEEQIRPHLQYEILIPAIRKALIDYSLGKVEQPLRQVIRVKDDAGEPAGWFATMPAVSGQFMAVKTVTFFPGNASIAGQPTHQAIIELLDRATGQPLAVMDGRLITEMRTAAVSAVALDALALRPVKTLGILGSGVQARSHIAALRLVQLGFCAPGAVRIWSRNPANAVQLAASVGAAAVPIEDAAACDVVVTVTSATTPILLGRWLMPDSLVIGVGAVGPRLRELDDDVMRGCLVAESRQGAEAESGDVLLSGAQIHAELGEILAGKVAAPENGRRVFKSLGMAIEDLTSAVAVWRSLGN
jgi:thiomorpholine-carboxylate dehydrogenase